jgi:type I restriction enzyme S subunit
MLAVVQKIENKFLEARRLRRESISECDTLSRSYAAQVLTAASASGADASLPDTGQHVRRRVEIPERMNAIAAAWSVPNGWLRVSVAELLIAGALLDVKDGNHGSNHPRASEFSNGGTPFLMASDLSRGSVQWDDVSHLPPEVVSRLRVGFAKPLDVLFTHKASIGKTAVVDRECILSPQVTYYRCNTDYIEPLWLQAFLGSDLFLQQLASIQEQSTRDFVSISKQYHQFLLLPPLADQRRMVKKLESLKEKLRGIRVLQDEVGLEINAIMPSMLDATFHGRLNLQSVPWT